MRNTGLEQMQLAQGYEKSGANVERKKLLSHQSRDFSNSLENHTIRRFLLKLAIFQILLLIVTASGYVFYQYLNWKSSYTQESHSIADFLTRSFSNDAVLIEVIESKLLKGKKLDQVLDIATYNSAFSHQNDYISVSALYLVKVNNGNKLIFTKHGKVSFAILPPEQFYNLLRMQSYPRLYVQQNEDIFIGKVVQHNSNSPNEFIILKIDLTNILQKIQSALKVKGSISILNLDDPSVKSAESKNLLSLGLSNLVLDYTPWSFAQHLAGNLYPLVVLILLFGTCLLTWIISTKSFFHKLMYQHQNRLLDTNQKITEFEHVINDLRVQGTSFTKACNSNNQLLGRLLLVGDRLFKGVEIASLDNVREAELLSDIINNCNNILVPEILKGHIQCVLNLDTEQMVSEESSLALYLLLLNFLFYSIYRTPKNGTILINVSTESNYTIISIKDEGFNIAIKNVDETAKLFCLPEDFLEELANKYNIKIVKTVTNQVNITAIKLLNKKHAPTKRKTREGNIIFFPSQA